MDMQRLRKPATVGVAAGVIAVLASGTAVALHDAETVHSCVNKRSGSVRIVAQPGQCTNSETSLDWNKQGQPGEPGTDGVSGYQIVTQDHLFASGVTSRFASETATCPDGKLAMGGGIRALVRFGPQDEVVEGSTSALTLHGFGPTAAGTGWTVSYAAQPSTAFVGVRAVATCALMATGG